MRPSAMSSTGEQLGRYHLVRKLATGGMAEVFLAKVMGPGGFEKQLVIKRILPKLARDPEFVSMFLAEARLAAQFGHPAVVQIFDFGEVNGSYFLAMEFVDGPNLRSILRAAPDRCISPVVGARVIEEACEGLAYVHEFAGDTGEPLGLMHCDVSTDNLLIAKNGAVKVVDFGVAKGAGQESNAAPGTVKGKIAYMPPEQIIGEADLRADVYALGVILYELAAGTRPYEQQPDQQLLATIIQTDPVPLLSRKPDLPREYANIVAKAMAKNLSQRFQNCRELASALDEFITGSGQRVGTRQLAALAAQYKEAPDGPPGAGTPVLATPQGKQLPPAIISPPKGAPAAAAPKSDPFAAFGAPATAPISKSDPFAAFGAAVKKPAPSAPSAPVPAAAAPSHSDELFSKFFSDLDSPVVETLDATVTTEEEPEPEGKKVEEFESGMKITVGSGGKLVSADVLKALRAPLAPLPAQPPAPAPVNVRPSSVQSAPVSPPPSQPTVHPEPSRGAVARPVAPPPSQPAAPPPSQPRAAPAAQVLSGAEARAAVVMADASHMRLYDAGATLASPEELEAIRREFERDDSLHVLVRFPCQAHRLLQTKDAEALVAERVIGAVEGLLLAEAWGACATLLERLRHSAGIDAHHRVIFEVALATLATPDQARRISQRLREAPPADAEGLGRLLPFFGAVFAPLWLNLFENLDLPGSRDAVLPGLAGLAALNPEPFLERVKVKRPRRLMELVFCIEKGNTSERQRLARELLARLDPARRREVLTGLARAATDDAFKLVCQAVTDNETRAAAGAEPVTARDLEETRLHAIQLLGKHFPDRVFAALQGLLAQGSSASEAERRAMWVAVGHSTAPAAYDFLAAELSQRAPLLGRAKHDARKVDALEALAVMKTPRSVELMKRLATDKALGESVRAAADRHVRAAEFVEGNTSHVGESRRWDRNPITWRDVLLDLAALAGGSRLVELDSASFDVAFLRLGKHLAHLLPAGTQAVVSCAPTLSVDGQVLQSGADPEAEKLAKVLQGRGIAGFTFTRQPARAELEGLVRWLAAGSAAEGVETPSITLLSANQTPPRPAAVPLVPPAMTDFSREALVRYVELVLGYRSWLSERKLNPRAEMPAVGQLFQDLAAAVSSRAVRFLGLMPRGRKRDAELYRAANVLTLSLVFGAELGLQHQQLVELASAAFFADVGTLDIKDEILERVGQLTEADQQEVAVARRWSARFPFVRFGDKPGAVALASAVLEQEVDWSSRERSGGTGANATVGLTGSLVALARAFETLTTATATRKAMTREEAAEVITQKAAHRFRPELLPLFAKFLQRVSLRPLG